MTHGIPNNLPAVNKNNNNVIDEYLIKTSENLGWITLPQSFVQSKND